SGQQRYPRNLHHVQGRHHEQIIAIGGKLHELSKAIQDDERQLHELTALLFNLSPAEESMVLRGRV
ncbi:hypothetical protein, partial [Novosphingobium sp.]|uniref:hypothetical protein n=1 Tax=Novosphingobium sp. TaxID=1874826 RepID=UPI003341EB25